MKWHNKWLYFLRVLCSTSNLAKGSDAVVQEWPWPCSWSRHLIFILMHNCTIVHPNVFGKLFAGICLVGRAAHIHASHIGVYGYCSVVWVIHVFWLIFSTSPHHPSPQGKTAQLHIEQAEQISLLPKLERFEITIFTFVLRVTNRLWAVKLVDFFDKTTKTSDSLLIYTEKCMTLDSLSAAQLKLYFNERRLTTRNGATNDRHMNTQYTISI